MTTITLKVTEQEKAFLQAMAKFEGKSLSGAIKETILDYYEDVYDAKVADQSIEEYEAYIASGGEETTWEELLNDLQA